MQPHLTVEDRVAPTTRAPRPTRTIAAAAVPATATVIILLTSAVARFIAVGREQRRCRPGTRRRSRFTGQRVSGDTRPVPEAHGSSCALCGALRAVRLRAIAVGLAKLAQ